MANPGIYPIDTADIKYALIATDSGTTGPTYATLKDLAAAAEFTIEFENGDERTLRGDGGVAQRSVAVGARTLTVRAGGIQPQAIADLYGHTLVQSGTTPNIKNTLTGKSNATRPWVKIEVQSLNNDQGDTHLVVYRCKADGEAPTLSLSDNEWGTLEMTFTVQDTLSTKVVNSVAQNLNWELVQNETAVAIA